MKVAPKKGGCVAKLDAPKANGKDVRPGWSKEPTTYFGEKIYFKKPTSSKTTYGSFRCYARIGDRVESTFSIKGKGKAFINEAWAACLACIENDPRPRA